VLTKGLISPCVTGWRRQLANPVAAMMEGAFRLMRKASFFVAEYAPGRAGLTRSYVSCKLCGLAGHRSEKEIMLQIQGRYNLDRDSG